MAGPAGDDAVGGRHLSVKAGGDVFLAGRDLILNEAGVPPFTVDGFVDSPPAGLDELTGSRQQPSALLIARRQAIVFTGRTAELAALQRWQDDPAVRRAPCVGVAWPGWAG